MMKIFGDLHTHSKFSRFNHGKNTVEENIESAREKGLLYYGVSDHGPKHIFYGVSTKNLKKARNIIDEYNKKQKELNVYLGCEANIVGKNGEIDLNNEQINLLDYIVVGYHKGTITNFVQFLFPKKTQKQIQKNTKAYINCINKYNVAFLSHLNTYIKVDVLTLAKECEKTNTCIEINTRHFNFSDDEMRDMLEKTNVKFIISSDSHRAKNIANVDFALSVAEKYKIDKSRIVNFNEDYVPKFVNSRG